MGAPRNVVAAMVVLVAERLVAHAVEAAEARRGGLRHAVLRVARNHRAAAVPGKAVPAHRGQGGSRSDALGVTLWRGDTLGPWEECMARFAREQEIVWKAARWNSSSSRSRSASGTSVLPPQGKLGRSSDVVLSARTSF